MSLPADWVDKIFTKLSLAYGRDFIGRWEGLDLADVKADWGHELAGFAAHPDAIAYALKHLPSKVPPTVLEFRDIARKAPAPVLPRLDAPVADKARVDEELQRLAPMRMRRDNLGGADPKAWARRILVRAEAGARINPLPLRMARQALGLEA